MAEKSSPRAQPANKDTPPPRRARRPTRNVSELVARRELWPKQEAAHRLGVGRTTLWKLIRDGEIEQLTVNGRGYISEREIQRYIANLEASAARAANGR